MTPKPDSSPTSSQLAIVDKATDLLDTKFVIPGTNLRFGADFLLGLVPGVGDAISLGISGLLIATMAKHGASGKLVARMLANVGLDALVGTIPLAGNAFDLVFKANTRNVELMRQYYDEDRHKGSVWPVVFGVVLVMTLIFAAIVTLGFVIVGSIANAFF